MAACHLNPPTCHAIHMPTSTAYLHALCLHSNPNVNSIELYSCIPQLAVDLVSRGIPCLRMFNVNDRDEVKVYEILADAFCVIQVRARVSLTNLGFTTAHKPTTGTR